MGFFFSDVSTTKGKRKVIPLNTAQKLECKVCPNNTKPLEHPKFTANGADKPLVYALYSRPMKADDAQGEHFSDPVFIEMLYRPLLQKFYDKELLRVNTTIRCHREGTISEIETVCCRNSIEQDIVASKPTVILAIGADALDWLLKERNVEGWHGRYFPINVKDHVCWCYSLPDPYFVKGKRFFKKGRDGQLIEKPGIWDVTLKKDLDNFESILPWLAKTTPPYVNNQLDIHKGIEYTENNHSKVLKWIEELKSEPIITYDIETNALRPYATNAKILTIALGTFDKTYAFPLEYSGVWNDTELKSIKKALKTLFKTRKLVIGHNVKFEIEWTAFKLGRDLLFEVPWACSQAQGYILDERRGMLSLDTLIKLHFGFNLKEISNLDRARMEQYSLEEILPYNALDVKWTHRLFEAQQTRFETDNDPLHYQAYLNLIAALPALTQAQMTGVDVDKTLHKQLVSDYKGLIRKIIKRIKALPEIDEYERKYGTFNPGSSQHILKVFQDILKLDDELKDKKGKIGTSEAVLSKLKREYELAELILLLRAEEKKLSTYIQPLLDHTFDLDGKIHTNFNPYITSTGRLSSNDPNMQNFPSRKGKEIRRLIVAPEECWLVSADYGQIEARLIALVSQDETYCEALWNDLDIHMEWAQKIAESYPDVIGGRQHLDNKEVMKKFRAEIKNKWTFPAFYGSSMYSIANAIGLPIEKASKLFDEFWATFKGVRTWQKWTENFYEKHGYVETLTGRRRHGPLSYNMIINSPIQGTASDFCVRGMTELAKAGIDIVLNIHDDVTSIVPDDKLEEHVKLIPEILLDIPYTWINVPLTVELSAGKNWCDKEEIGTFSSTDYKKIPTTLKELGHYRT